MAYDSTNETLSSDPTGITLKEISRCIKDYRVDTNGRTDLGMMCTSPNIKPNALYKPYETGSPVNPTFATGGPNGTYGYTIPVTYANNVLEDLKEQSWTFNPPTTYYRQSDFDGYTHLAKYEDSNFGLALVITDPTTKTFKITFNGAVTEGRVNPYEMQIFKNAYYAFSIFLYYVSGPDEIAGKTIHALSRCCQNSIGSGMGEYINDTYSPESLAGETYAQYLSMIYVVPFISEYYFDEETSATPSFSTGRKWVLGFPSYQGRSIPVNNYIVRAFEVDCEITEVNNDMGVYQAAFTYTFEKAISYMTPTYRWRVVNPNTGAVHSSQEAWINIASGMSGEAGDVITHYVTIGAGEGKPVPSGYFLWVEHKEQTGADGNYDHYGEYLYIIP